MCNLPNKSKLNIVQLHVVQKYMDVPKEKNLATQLVLQQISGPPYLCNLRQKSLNIMYSAMGYEITGVPKCDFGPIAYPCNVKFYR